MEAWQKDHALKKLTLIRISLSVKISQKLYEMTSTGATVNYQNYVVLNELYEQDNPSGYLEKLEKVESRHAINDVDGEFLQLLDEVYSASDYREERKVAEFARKSLKRNP